ncbi:MAG: paraquat-inducible protein A [Desulfobacteraceae bacterium]|nr:paraquat-inducible protein A [Desulfobacteraceae bacterium]
MQNSAYYLNKKNTKSNEIRICLNCDLLQNVSDLKPGFNARCRRCGCILVSKNSGALNKSLALTIASLILFFPAVCFPLLRVKLFGETKSASILNGASDLFNSGFFFIAALVFLFAFLIPFLKYLTLFYTLLSVYFRIKLPFVSRVFKIYCLIKSFAMEEVFLMAALTALTKLDSIADYEIESGFYFFSAFIIISVSAISVITDSEIWERLENL